MLDTYVQVSTWTYAFIFLGMYLGVELLCCMVTLCLTHLGTARRAFQNSSTTLNSHQQGMMNQTFYIPINTYYCLFSQNYSLPCGWEIISLMVLIFISVMTDGIEHLFMLLLVIFTSLEKCLFKTFIHFELVCVTFNYPIIMFVYISRSESLSAT